MRLMDCGRMSAQFGPRRKRPLEAVQQSDKGAAIKLLETTNQLNQHIADLRVELAGIHSGLDNVNNGISSLKYEISQLQKITQYQQVSLNDPKNIAALFLADCVEKRRRKRGKLSSSPRWEAALPDDQSFLTLAPD